MNEFNPIEQAKRKPASKTAAIKAMCYRCMGMEGGWRKEVEQCTDKECPLYRHRPRTRGVASS